MHYNHSHPLDNVTFRSSRCGLGALLSLTYSNHRDIEVLGTMATLVTYRRYLPMKTLLKEGTGYGENCGDVVKNEYYI